MDVKANSLYQEMQSMIGQTRMPANELQPSNEINPSANLNLYPLNHRRLWLPHAPPTRSSARGH